MYEIPSCLWAVTQALSLLLHILFTILILDLWYLIPVSVISIFCSQVYSPHNNTIQIRYVFELSATTGFFSLLVKIPLVLWDSLIQTYKAKALCWNIAAHFSLLRQIVLAGSFYSLPCKWWKPLFVKQKCEGSPAKDIFIVHCLCIMVSWHGRKNIRGLFLAKAPCKYNICMLWCFAHIIIIQFKIVCFQGLKSKKIRIMTLNCTAKDTTYLYYVSSQHSNCIFFLGTHCPAKWISTAAM